MEKINTKTVVCVLAATGCLLTAPLSQAADEVYVFASGGRSTADVAAYSAGKFSSAGVYGSAYSKNIDKKSATAKVGLGLNCGDWWGMELGYHYLGKAEGDLQYLSYYRRAKGTFSVESQAAFIDFLVRLPVSDYGQLFAKLGTGLAFTETKANIPGIASRDEWTVSAPMKIGVGADVNVTEHLAVRLEWEYYGNVGSDVRDDNAFSAWTAGLKYNF